MDEERPDVIGVGALNIDYIFDYKASEEALLVKALESGAETLCVESSNVEKAIRISLERRHRRYIGLGGSAFLTIRTIASMDLGLRTAFVGVLGREGDLENSTGLNESLDDALKSVHNHTGCSLLKMLQP